MIIWLFHPELRQVINLRMPDEKHLLNMFLRNGWRPHGDLSRAVVNLAAD
jgi:hypothetical protein